MTTCPPSRRRRLRAARGRRRGHLRVRRRGRRRRAPGAGRHAGTARASVVTAKALRSDLPASAPVTATTYRATGSASPVDASLPGQRSGSPPAGPGQRHGPAAAGHGRHPGTPGPRESSPAVYRSAPVGTRAGPAPDAVDPEPEPTPTRPRADAAAATGTGTRAGPGSVPARPGADAGTPPTPPPGPVPPVRARPIPPPSPVPPIPARRRRPSRARRCRRPARRCPHRRPARPDAGTAVPAAAGDDRHARRTGQPRRSPRRRPDGRPRWGGPPDVRSAVDARQPPPRRRWCPRPRCRAGRRPPPGLRRRPGAAPAAARRPRHRATASAAPAGTAGGARPAPVVGGRTALRPGRHRRRHGEGPGFTTVAIPANAVENSGSLTGHILAQGWSDTPAERSSNTRVVIVLAAALGLLVAISVAGRPAAPATPLDGLVGSVPQRVSSE